MSFLAATNQSIFLKFRDKGLKLSVKQRTVVVDVCIYSTPTSEI